MLYNQIKNTCVEIRFHANKKIKFPSWLVNLYVTLKITHMIHSPYKDQKQKGVQVFYMLWEKLYTEVIENQLYN